MQENTAPPLLGRLQTFSLVFLSIFIVSFLLLLRSELNPSGLLNEMARKSIDPYIALSNGKPTLIEFYADWCKACRSMAPQMISLEKKFGNELDIVMLNVDNEEWQDLMQTYEVLGIPQLNFFDSNSQPFGKSIGLRNYQDLEVISNALLEGSAMPDLPGVSEFDVTNLKANSEKRELKRGSENVAPRSHA